MHEKLTAYLAECKVGDTVYVSTGNHYRELSVDKALPSQLVCGGRRFNRVTGRLIGGDRIYQTRILYPSETVVAKARTFILNEWADVEFARQFKALSLERRAQVYALVQPMLAESNSGS